MIHLLYLPLFTKLSQLGVNALNALRGLGLLDAVLERSEEKEPRLRPFKFISGMKDHELVFDVSESTYA